MSLGKIALGALATTALAWFMNGPLHIGDRCAASATPAVTAPVVDTAANAIAAPVATAESAACQTNVTALMTGKTINFETSRAAIAASSQGLIDEVAAAVKGCQGVAIEVGGHTDARGDDASNQTLSEARAAAVVAALTAKGVPADRLTSKGFGETKPLDPANTPEALAKNRRIEFNVSAAAPAQQPAG
ncbi:MAG: hypothetical protein RIS52_957 [Pseudomonadota bacterium]